ncbi:MAG: TonB family protein [Acidobacteriota bacterium]|nr:TonB family protein [Acidobacteriota bacterium]
MLIDEDGAVVDSEIVEKARFALFDQAATAAAAKARCAPATLDGIAGKSWVRLRYDFDTAN